jgi:hypothetical protein
VRLPRFKKKFVAIGLASGIAIGAGGIAAAYFTASGTGTGSASVGSPTPFTITQFATFGTLGPGGTPQTLTFRIANTYLTKQHLSTVTASVVAAVTGNIETATQPGHTPVPGCSASTFSTTLTPTPVTITLTLGTTQVVTVTVFMHTNTSTQIACAGKHPLVNVHAGP